MTLNHSGNPFFLNILAAPLGACVGSTLQLLIMFRTFDMNSMVGMVDTYDMVGVVN